MKKYAGAILVAVAGLVAWWWWKRRQTGAKLDPSGAVTIPPNGDTSFPALQQVGSTVNQDVTGDVLDRVLAFVEKLQAGCWLQQPPKDGRYSYKNSITGAVVYVDVNRVALDAPRPLCGQ